MLRVETRVGALGGFLPDDLVDLGTTGAGGGDGEGLGVEFGDRRGAGSTGIGPGTIGGGLGTGGTIRGPGGAAGGGSI